METNAGLGGLIGFSYAEADNGVQSLHKHKNRKSKYSYRKYEYSISTSTNKLEFTVL